MHKKLTSVTAFAAGVGAGMVGGLLLAPHKGKVTRAKLRERAETGKERTEEQTAKLKGRLQKMIDEIK